MKKLIIISGLTLALCAFAYSAGVGGTKNDPLVSTSSVDDTINSYVNEYINDTLDLYEESQITGSLVYNQVNKVGYVLNDVVTVTPGCKIVLTTGTVSVTGSGQLISVSDARVITDPYSLMANNTYIVAENSSFDIKFTSLSGKMTIDGNYSYTNVYETKYSEYANALHSLGLFKGTDYGYELNRPATRTESLIMLIRLLGEEEAALAHVGTHPFTDVPSWANSYVSYAYEKGYTNGYSETTFGSYEYVRVADYYTFLLRALKYVDNVDFTWYTAEEKGLSIGLATSTDADFYRDFIAYLSYNALSQKINGTSTTLADNLISNGAFTKSEYYDSQDIIK